VARDPRHLGKCRTLIRDEVQDKSRDDRIDGFVFQRDLRCIASLKHCPARKMISCAFKKSLGRLDAGDRSGRAAIQNASA
jgi:hypothetical protein